MEREKVGGLLSALRRERGMTQAQVAQRLHVSVKAVSKWETGRGLPDVSLLGALSALFDIPAETLLAGQMDRQETDGGNMKRLQFYVCPDCGAFLSGTGQAQVSCCGKKLAALVPQKWEAPHAPLVQPVEDEWYLSFEHPMTKDHHISFVALVGDSRVLTVKLYPEGEAALRLPRPRGGGKMYFHCTRHGLFESKL